MIALYHQTNTPISFWCRRGLNPRSLIQPSETLPVELTGTHIITYYLKFIVKILCMNHFFFFLRYNPRGPAPFFSKYQKYPLHLSLLSHTHTPTNTKTQNTENSLSLFLSLSHSILCLGAI